MTPVFGFTIDLCDHARLRERFHGAARSVLARSIVARSISAHL
ncbi:MAG: isopropylmalate isomerase [Paracoccaceae bacterium]